VTQSALSQRVMLLEESLGLTLFIRSAAGIRLTDVGERLLRYCQVRGSLEEELLGDLRNPQGKELSGTLRIAGYSSVVRSLLLPSLAPFLRKNPRVRCDFFSREMRDLPGMLLRAEADMIVIDHGWDRSDLTRLAIGREEYVVIESSRHPTPKDVYLDHDPSDTATELFFKRQPARPEKYERLFFDDVYGVMDGVAQGLGRAVMSRHLVDKRLPVRIVKGFKPRSVDVVLHHFTLPFYSKLHSAVVTELSSRATS
jgi:DNA-binding transcriptional LysR family regulator